MVIKMNFVKYFILIFTFSKAYGLKVEVLAPVNNSTVEAGLIITPGADIKGQAYKPLAEAIQKATNLKLWLAILEDFPFNVPNPIQLDYGINEAIDKMGITNGNVFLAGHSLGGVFVGSYGLKHAKKLKGILLFASYLTRSHRLQDYPLPVLHISGDLDGLTRITRIVDTFEELVYNMKTVSYETMYHMPVIVMEGINHGHFASGTMPPNVKSHDLEAEMSYDSAHSIIAGHVGAFLVKSLEQPTEQVSEAEAALNKSFDDTLAITQVREAYGEQSGLVLLITMTRNDINTKFMHNISSGPDASWPVCNLLKLQVQDSKENASIRPDTKAKFVVTSLSRLPVRSPHPLSTVKSWDFASGNENDTTRRAQEIILGSKLANHTTIADTQVSETEFVFKEPIAEADDVNHAKIQTYSHVALPFNPEDVSESPQTPAEVQSKMVTKQDLMILLPNVTADSKNNTCMQVNQLIYEMAISLASARAQQRYKSSGSPPIMFHPDMQVSFATEWIASSLKLEYGSNNKLDVTSYSYMVLPESENRSNSIGRLIPSVGRRKRQTKYSQGYYYCKLLSPYRALEWYYIDALKPST